MALLKVLLVGPPKVGKSVLANFFADTMSEAVRGSYRPTKGCRIMEVQRDSLHRESTSYNTVFELWDVSGSDEFDHCWTAASREATGVVFVFNPDEEGQEKSLLKWYQLFATRYGLADERCMVFANQIKHMRGRPRDVQLPDQMGGVQMVYTNTQENPEVVRDTFQKFMTQLFDMDAKRQDKEERSILM
eukprot:m.40815 g.40815  ORF g.40815 m.40815 type:complete len:189 (+) comp14860_c0_seq1:159-725(+)